MERSLFVLSCMKNSHIEGGGRIIEEEKSWKILENVRQSRRKVMPEGREDCAKPTPGNLICYPNEE